MDKLTRLAVELRAGRESVWQQRASVVFGLSMAVCWGVMLWSFDSSPGSFFAYLGALITSFYFFSEAERRTSERLERLEEAIAMLADEAAKRSRDNDRQIVPPQPPSS